MGTQIILMVLALRHRLRQWDRWDAPPAHKWLLSAFVALWDAALALFWLEGGGERRTANV